jgi:hypothetical protein
MELKLKPKNLLTIWQESARNEKAIKRLNVSVFGFHGIATWDLNQGPIDYESIGLLKKMIFNHLKGSYLVATFDSKGSRQSGSYD